MDWIETTFLDWPCWESGPFRIMEVNGYYELFFDKGIATDVWQFKSLEEAKEKAEHVRVDTD